jgi:hypothetical protein
VFITSPQLRNLVTDIKSGTFNIIISIVVDSSTPVYTNSWSEKPHYKGYFPISLEKLKDENKQLYDMISKTWV